MSGAKGILSRYAAVLDAIASRPDGLSLTETMQATGLPRGTMHRLLGALQDIGYLASRDSRKVYVLGPRLVRLLQLGVSPASVDAVARPILDGLVEKLGETAFLARLAGDRVESFAIADPNRDGQSHVRPGRDMPIHAAASAKAIFAFQESSLIERALERPRSRYTENTRVDAAHVRHDLETVRREGYAVCANELDPGVLSYAVPVRVEGVGVVYSVGVVGLSARLARYTEAQLAGDLRAAAQSISARLCHGGQI
ncbi:MAG: IclR family transcriptional regulator [Gammaproteobacteria bacterium]|nr:MAG: IclR family transcriptional regulator [Gammaproteobacteria bacterium]